MIRMGVHVEFSRRVARGGPASFHRAMNGVPFAIAVAYAREVHKRVALRAQPVGRFSSYDTGRVRLVSPRYPVSGGRITRSGAQLFESSAVMHRAAGARPGAFSVSGGMWAGRTALVAGTRVARVAIRGRSEGQGMSVSRSRNEPYFDGAGRARPKKVSNALKAATVLRSTGINVLAFAPDDWRSVGAAAVDMARNGARDAFFADIEFHTPPASRAALARAIVANGVTNNNFVSHVPSGISFGRRK